MCKVRMFIAFVLPSAAFLIMQASSGMKLLSVRETMWLLHQLLCKGGVKAIYPYHVFKLLLVH